MKTFVLKELKKYASNIFLMNIEAIFIKYNINQFF